MRRPLILLVACGVLAACEEAPPPAATPNNTALEISAAPLSAVLEASRFQAPAQAISRQEAEIAAEVSARIMALPFDVGSSVRAGDVVVQLDARDAELALKQASATLAQAVARHRQGQANLRRAKELAAQRFISEEGLVQRRTELATLAADVAAARAGRAAAQRQVEKCTLRAPFDAVVHARPATLGELAAPGAPLITLWQAGDVEVAARIQAADATQLVPDTTGVFEASSGRYPVKLRILSPLIDRGTRTVEARFAFTGKASPAGDDGRLRWESAQRNQIASGLLVRRKGEIGVFVTEAGKARFVVLPGAEEGRPASVPEDFDKALMIVTKGQQALETGHAVRLREVP